MTKSKERLRRNQEASCRTPNGSANHCGAFRSINARMASKAKNRKKP
jgi:hypothetical protein